MEREKIIQELQKHDSTIPGFPGPWSLGIQFLPRELLRMDPCIPRLEIPGYKDGRTVCRIRDGI